MKHLEKMKFTITVLVAMCLLCAVAAFFLPNAQGMVLSYLAIALAAAVAVLCVAGLAMLLHHPNAAA
ncbi:MAG: hypothetical protein E7469_07740 [Ruminococcaceae bacterium]|nr:hypothetical protein [Oscillospiraceae bacterium]